jgi:hypothetical protein
MPQQLSLLMRTADQTRKAEIQLPSNLRIEQLVQQAQKQWNLPEGVSYALRLERTGKQLDPASTLYPILEAGNYA